MTHPFIRRIFLFILAASFVIGGGALSAPHEHAQASPKVQQTPTQQSCESCHQEIQELWFEGAHSSARTSHVLEESHDCLACHPNKIGDGQSLQTPSTPMDDSLEGTNICVTCHTTGYDPDTGQSKSYGITCEACHGPAPSNHPDEDMPVISNTDACGRCHSDARFNWDQWEKSTHYQQNMRCVECHDPHSTTLHGVEGTGNTDQSALCVQCHNNDEIISRYSIHGRAGVSCVKCHLGEKTGPDAFHVVPNHSFKPEIATCNECHAEKLHQRSNSGNIPPVVSGSTSTPPASETPLQGPIGGDLPGQGTNKQWLWLVLLLIAGLMGLVIGLALSILAKKPRR